jgi:hypothetical protein
MEKLRRREVRRNRSLERKRRLAEKADAKRSERNEKIRAIQGKMAAAGVHERLRDVNAALVARSGPIRDELKLRGPELRSVLDVSRVVTDLLLRDGVDMTDVQIVVDWNGKNLRFTVTPTFESAAAAATAQAV